VGKHRYWYRNGNLKMRGSYEGGELNGRWEYYDEMGMPTLTMDYELGIAVKINGQKIKLPKEKGEGD
jgi:antitoxin component YwqK of YwqJK toxin-antitoxin module